MTPARPLRIGIGAQILGKQKGGVETCVESLIDALQLIETPHRFILYISKGSPLQSKALPHNFELRTPASNNPWIERPLLTPTAFRHDKLDVIFLQRALPLWGCRPAVVHLHDAIYLTHPELFPRWKRAVLAATFKRSVRKAAMIVTPSAAARADIVKHYGAATEKVVVVPNAVDFSAFGTGDGKPAVTQVLGRFSLRRPYVAYLGAVERNKNLHLLIQAFASFRQHRPEHSLALVGKWRQETRGGYSEELRGLIRANGLGEAVRFTGYVSADDRRCLLAGADMMVFPSVAEGFGLPPLEAMASGVPVVAARIPATEEVCGNAAILVEPNSSSALTEAMLRLGEGERLRAELIARGLNRVNEYSWRRSAEKLLGVLEQAAGT